MSSSHCDLSFLVRFLVTYMNHEVKLVSIWGYCCKAFVSSAIIDRLLYLFLQVSSKIYVFWEVTWIEIVLRTWWQLVTRWTLTSICCNNELSSLCISSPIIYRWQLKCLLGFLAFHNWAQSWAYISIIMPFVNSMIRHLPMFMCLMLFSLFHCSVSLGSKLFRDLDDFRRVRALTDPLVLASSMSTLLEFYCECYLLHCLQLVSFSRRCTLFLSHQLRLDCWGAFFNLFSYIHLWLKLCQGLRHYRRNLLSIFLVHFENCSISVDFFQIFILL